MIFVCLGSQKFQFNRLLKKLDEYKKSNVISKDIYVQRGYSDYKPEYLEFTDFLSNEQFKRYIEKSELVITHGGTGAIITSIKNKKKVIAIPRLAKYGEHVDDHQIEIVKQFEEMNLISSCYDIEELYDKIEEIQEKKFNTYTSNTDVIIEDIGNYIDTL